MADACKHLPNGRCMEGIRRVVLLGIAFARLARPLAVVLLGQLAAGVRAVLLLSGVITWALHMHGCKLHVAVMEQ